MHRLTRPPDAAIEWAGEVVGSRIARVKPLTGGMSTGIHLLTTESGERVVMRRFVNQEWLALDPDLARREAAVLEALEPTPVPAPALVGVDPYGDRCGAPTVLMSFVAGSRKPAGELSAWAAELARAMATIHDVAPPAVDGLPDELERLARTIGEDTTNRHGSFPSTAFWALVRDGYPHVSFRQNVLIHDDFHPGNVLFSRGKLTAVVDWPLAGAGQPASEVAFCRVDAGMMLGLEAADLILAAYESETGAPVPDLWWWDLYAASRAETDLEVWTESYAGIGPADLTVATVRKRFAAFVERARRDRP